MLDKLLFFSTGPTNTDLPDEDAEPVNDARDPDYECPSAETEHAILCTSMTEVAGTGTSKLCKNILKRVR